MIKKLFAYLANEVIQDILNKRLIVIKDKLNTHITEQTRLIVHETIVEMFEESSDFTYTEYGFKLHKIGATFQERMMGRIKEKVDDTVERKTIALVHGEDFIDSVITRINNKQLG